MATEQTEPVDVDSFEAPDVEQTSDNPLDLEPGDEYIGRITEFKPSAGDNGLLVIDGEDLWLNKTMQKQLLSALVEGEHVMFAKGEDSESFTDSDGNVQEYYPRSLKFQD